MTHGYNACKNVFSEIKRLMQIMVIINDMPGKKDTIELDCLIGNLQAFDCRKGCPNCGANELFNKLENAYGKKGFDSGKSRISKT